MNIFKRIRKHLDEIGEHPWAVGFNADGASKKTLTAWQMLTIEERLAISKNNPFVPERKNCLLGLRLQGYEQSILTELSGLSIQTIRRVTAAPRGKKTESE